MFGWISGRSRSELFKCAFVSFVCVCFMCVLFIVVCYLCLCVVLFVLWATSLLTL